jgi:hypothetical protein
MADYPSNTKWLTHEEQLLAAQRLAYDGLGNAQGAHGRITEMQALKMVVSDWRTWILALLYALVTGAQTIQYFIPTLVKDFGWENWEGQCKYHTRWYFLLEQELITPWARPYYSALCLCCGLHIGNVFCCRPL